MKLKLAVAFIFTVFLSFPLFAGDADLSYVVKVGDNTHMIVLNLSSNTIVRKGKKGNGPWKTFNKYRITSVDSNSRVLREIESMEIKYDDGSIRGNSYVLRNDLSVLQAGKTFHLVTPLNFSYSSGGRKYKYVLEPGIRKGAYYTSTGAAWQKLSEFKILSVKNEGQKFNGTPVLTLYFRSGKGINNKLLISSRWDKMAGPLNKWFYRSR